MSAIDRKPQILANRAIKLGLLFGVVLILFVFYSNSAQALDIPFLDNFNSYSDGYLTGQGDWTIDVPIERSWIVQGENVYEGSKAIKCLPIEGINTYCSNTKIGEPIISGIWRFYIKGENCRPLSFYFIRDEYEYSIRISTINSVGKCFISKYPFTEGNEILEFPLDYLNVFRKVLVEWTSSQFRVMVGDYGWSDWYPTSYTPIKGIRITGGTDYVNAGYIDYFAPEYTPECNSLCWYCDYLGCLDYPESCYWAGETCVPFFECGSDWLCEYCLNQEECEEKNCYWNLDDGFCWSSAPPILPELEDCSELGITDRLLCELKNFFYRLFVPTSQKIMELRDTTSEVRDKFPYNYVLAIKNFFVYLKENINENQETSFKVLGQAGIINFDFWDTEITIAGVNQSFSDILKTFFKFLIILVFALWCFSFIKRIFK